LDALLTNENVPTAHPATVGVNIRLTLTPCPAAKVNGRVKPATLNAEMLVFTAVTVTLVVPAFVRLTATVSV
jgi:hypothetical protein